MIWSNSWALRLAARISSRKMIKQIDQVFDQECERRGLVVHKKYESGYMERELERRYLFRNGDYHLKITPGGRITGILSIHGKFVASHTFNAKDEMPFEIRDIAKVLCDAELGVGGEE